MPKVKADYSDVSEQEGFDTYEGEAPKPGVYEAVLTSCAEHTSKAGNEGLRWIFEITEEGPFTGWPGLDRPGQEGQAPGVGQRPRAQAGQADGRQAPDHQQDVRG
jgi:hypothetical protein